MISHTIAQSVLKSHEKLNCHEFWVTLRVMVSLQHIKHKKLNQCSCWRRFLNPHPRQTFVPGFLIIIIYLFFFCNPTVSQQGFRFEYAKAYLRSSVYYSFFDNMFEEQQEIQAPLNSTDPLIISILFPLFQYMRQRETTQTQKWSELCISFVIFMEIVRTSCCHKVFLAIFPFEDLKERFAILRENNSEPIFPSPYEDFWINWTLPVTRATVES